MSDRVEGNGAILQFLGGTGTVTGSRFLLETARSSVLVDCGLYQGIKSLRVRNWERFPVDVASLDAVLLTHAHVDHSGYLPALAKAGFRGSVYATGRTRELCGIVLRDSARLMQEEAKYANRKGFSKHHPALPLYTPKDAEDILARFVPVEYASSVQVADQVRASFQPAGHILGSASIEVDLDGPDPRSVCVSGDLGRAQHPLLVPPSPPPGVDALLVESTYGNRRHGDDGAVEALADAIVRTAERGGVVVIPAFAVDRTEVILMNLKRLMEAGRIPMLPVHVDSPMALAALGVYRSAIAEGDQEIRSELHGQADPFDAGQLAECRDVEASKALQASHQPGIIIAAAGMATGGRVLHHLASRLPDARNSVVFVGFQAAQTRGRRLLEGTGPIKMLGSYVPVHAEIVDCTALSVHADRVEILTWLKGAAEPPGTLYVVHGESTASESLAKLIRRELGWNAVVPDYKERVRIGDVSG